MAATLRALLSEIIDYAGLFPPARLPMAEAVASYFRYQSGPEGWVMNRFLCPAGQLLELSDILGDKALAVGVIGTGGEGYDAFQTGLEADARVMTAFEDRHGDACPIETYETRLPAGEELGRIVNDLRGFDRAEVFLELPWGAAQGDQLAELAELEWLGAKARTGGKEPTAFPSSEALAGFLKDAQDLEIPFKLTAGLHQPLRYFDETDQAWHHGFVNILAALNLNAAEDFSRAEMAEILDCQEFDPRWFGGVDPSLRDTFCGFGSCSIEEPLDGLARLGIAREVSR